MLDMAYVFQACSLQPLIIACYLVRPLSVECDELDLFVYVHSLFDYSITPKSSIVFNSIDTGSLYASDFLYYLICTLLQGSVKPNRTEWYPL